jgi:hypothetical protein
MTGKIDFSTFVLSVSSAAMMAMTHEESADLELASQNIGLLELMEEKTRGNLTSDESKLLEQLLFEIRMKFVESKKAK